MAAGEHLEWMSWGQCSQTCGGTRQRVCICRLTIGVNECQEGESETENCAPCPPPAIGNFTYLTTYLPTYLPMSVPNAETRSSIYIRQ